MTYKKTVQRDEIIEYLHCYLEVEKFEDHCVNGLQVEGSTQISKIATGVSVSRRLFERAHEENADLILVHHGLFWKRDPTPFTLTGILRQRVSILIKNNINLSAYHLPLDAHETLGNNSIICKELGVIKRTPMDVGFVGRFDGPIPLSQLLDRVRNKIHPQPQIFTFGPNTVTKLAVLSGGGSSALSTAAQADADTYLTGEILEPSVRLAEEFGINYINAGHYNTELFGIKALGNHVAEKFKLPHVFLDIPNPI